MSTLSDLSLSELTAISPVDGRYRRQTKVLSHFFSEFSLIRYRLKVECEYVYFLTSYLEKHVDSFKLEHPLDLETIRRIYHPEHFTLEEAEKVKAHERVINHDVKAVEYYLKDQFDNLNWKDAKEWIHFGLTSQDINNVAIPLALKDFMDYYFEQLESLLSILTNLATSWMEQPMLAYTHGQPATPTRLGKEIYVWVERVKKQVELLKLVPHSGKFGGATGQYNAHVVAFPNIQWPEFGDAFMAELGLTREQWTTQISNYDNMAALFDGMKRINVILIDLCKDVWQYISMTYFKQKILEAEVGSSAMPHKVNPIDFENAEGNLLMANAQLEFLASKLPISRLQRDLTDSTTLRNVGVPLAHTLIAWQSLKRGLGKLMMNQTSIEEDLQENYVVISEAIQTILRREGVEQPYEKLKALTRTGDKIDKKSFDAFVDGLEVSEELKAELKNVTPFNFIGQVPLLKQ